MMGTFSDYAEMVIQVRFTLRDIDIYQHSIVIYYFDHDHVCVYVNGVLVWIHDHVYYRIPTCCFDVFS